MVFRMTSETWGHTYVWLSQMSFERPQMSFERVKYVLFPRKSPVIRKSPYFTSHHGHTYVLLSQMSFERVLSQMSVERELSQMSFERVFSQMSFESMSLFRKSFQIYHIKPNLRKMEVRTLGSFRRRATNYRALLREMTHKDKAFYGSSRPCISDVVLHLLIKITSHRREYEFWKDLIRRH